MKTIRALVVCVLLVLLVLVAVSYFNGNASFRYSSERRPSATGTTGIIDTAAARERGAEVGEKVAVAAEKVKDAAEEGAITSKIKAKMVLDDNIKARAIDVTTHGSTVTLSGVVRSATERERAVALARETTGITRVVDRLVVER
jgi:hyperosmotically inducible protein